MHMLEFQTALRFQRVASVNFFLYDYVCGACKSQSFRRNTGYDKRPFLSRDVTVQSYWEHFGKVHEENFHRSEKRFVPSIIIIKFHKSVPLLRKIWSEKLYSIRFLNKFFFSPDVASERGHLRSKHVVCDLIFLMNLRGV